MDTERIKANILGIDRVNGVDISKNDGAIDVRTEINKTGDPYKDFEITWKTWATIKETIESMCTRKVKVTIT